LLVSIPEVRRVDEKPLQGLKPLIGQVGVVAVETATYNDGSL
jgi:hypothetical protein